MKSLKLLFVLPLTLSLFFVSCKKEIKKGCTDPVATNYNYLAEEDDGSCEYLDSSFTIWNNGTAGYWGDQLTGTFTIQSCTVDSSTIFMNPDTTFIAADTIITPIDTTYIPADTIVNGDTYLLVLSDSLGNYGLTARLSNNKNALTFGDGYLVFDAMLHPSSNLTEYNVFIHGNLLNPQGNCANLYQSDVITASTTVLDTNSFTEIVMPLLNFPDRHMKSINLVFGLQGTNADPNSPLLIINNVRWVTRLEE